MLSSNNDILLYLDKLSRKLKHIQCCLNNNAFTFTYGTEDPVDPLNPVSSNGLYLRTDTGDLWEWNGIGWTFIYNFSSGGGTQDLQSVLDQGHSAVNQIIELFGDNSYINVYATDNVVTSSFGVDTEPKILLTNSLGYKITLRASLASSNTVEFPANSGTLALLSDIPPATPTVISTKTTSYQLQLSDADFDTLFEMDSATDEEFTIESSVAFPIGTSFIFARRGTGEVNIVGSGSTVILSANGATNLTYQDSGATLIKVSATEWYLFGDIGTPNTTTPGGNDRELQFNDGGVAFGGATGFSYDPTNTHGLVELVSTDDTKSLFSIQGPPTSSNIFEVTDEANPGVGDYFRVGANIGYMSGVWTISNGGKLTISTSAAGVSDMLKLTNSLGTKTHSISYTDTGDFLIKDVTNNEIDAFIKGNNAAFGQKAGNYSNISGPVNSAFGSFALYLITTGQYNTGIGSGALQSLTTGEYNTGIGSGSLSAAVTTSRNTAIGWASMFESTAANYCTIAGWYAGRHVQGNYFTGLGYQAFGGAAGAITQTGQKNIAIGDNAAVTLRTGSFNTVIGSEADVAAATNYGIALGYQAVAASNQLAISPNVTQIKATGLTTSADRVLTDIAGNGILTLEPKRPYQVLIGNLTQTGFSAPTFTIFENTTGTTYTTNYKGVGWYDIQAVGTPFTTGKTQVFIGAGRASFNSDPAIIHTSFDSQNLIEISVIGPDYNRYDDVLYETSIEIRIYP